MKSSLSIAVRLRAGGVCEYCHFPIEYSPAPFPIDHIIAQQHGGESVLENLALACFNCNASKGPNIASIDPKTKKLTRLFNPRRDAWSQHFQWDDFELVGRTPIGRATILVLSINHPEFVEWRKHLHEEGIVIL